eukprot:CAMPEP_0115026982 /NCGR_PEP_ID=MMETSP0216-20121206/35143_1 /TAXON_ID=223996 /ORGANISM="Protocruzia adherens, Strain Boccale" /LENGTH=101 /DNA_ID=CAMNT_0002402307 /DNA_START=16 /DNA_END=317 /DNA_ORIENTATION=-
MSSETYNSSRFRNYRQAISPNKMKKFSQGSGAQLTVSTNVEEGKGTSSFTGSQTLSTTEDLARLMRNTSEDAGMFTEAERTREIDPYSYRKVGEGVANVDT